MALFVSLVLAAQDLWDGTTIATGFHAGWGTADHPYEIRTGAQLKYFEQRVNEGYDFNGCTVRLMNDINMNRHPLALTKPFTGIFDGNGHYLTVEFHDAPIFSSVQGRINHLGIRAEVFRDDRYPYYGIIYLVGSLENGGVVENCHYIVKNDYFIGYVTALVNNNRGTVRNCYATGNYRVYDSGGAWGAIIKGMLVSTNHETGVVENCMGDTYNNGSNAHGQAFPLITTNKGTLIEGTNTTMDYFATPNPCMVEFVDLKFGQQTDPKTVTLNDVVGTLPTLTSTWSFIGWQRYGEKVMEADVVNGNWTLFAMWDQLIRKQPTKENMSVEVDDVSHASYQWYKTIGEGYTTYEDWDSKTVRSKQIDLCAVAGQVISFSYRVSSEEGYDFFLVSFDGDIIFKESGEKSGTFEYKIPTTGNHTLFFSYSKDEDTSHGEDMAKVWNFIISGQGFELPCTSSTLDESLIQHDGYYYCQIRYSNSNKILLSDAVNCLLAPEDIDNTIYLENTMAMTGSKKTLSVRMKNTVSIQGFQFDLYLPNGVSVARGDDGLPLVTLSEERTTTRHTDYFNSAFTEDGALRVLCTSTGGYAFYGDDGEVAKIVVDVPEDMALGEYSLVLRNITVTDISSDGYDTDYLESKLVVVDVYLMGDVNADQRVNVTDFTAMANHILGRTPSDFRQKAADMNDDGKVNVTDLTIVANLILFAEVSIDMSRKKIPSDVVSMDNVVYVEPVSMRAGSEQVLSIRMKNRTDIQGFQFDLNLPEGLHVVTDGDGMPKVMLSEERTNHRKTDYFNSVIRRDGSLRVLCSSTLGYTFVGNDGEVAQVVVRADEDMEQADYPLVLSNITVTDSQSCGYDTDNYETTVSIIMSVEDETTGILHNERKVGYGAERIFDLQGRRISKPMRKGLYIEESKNKVRAN